MTIQYAVDIGTEPHQVPTNAMLGTMAYQDQNSVAICNAKINNLTQETGWKDILSSVSGAKVPASSAPVTTAFGVSGNQQQYAFAINDYVILNPFHLNHDIKPNGLAYFHVHWSTSGTDVNTVKWEIEHMYANGHNQAAFPAPTTISVEEAASATAWQHMVTEVGVGDAITMLEPDGLILPVLKRVTNGGTDNAASVFGLQVDLHYESDRDTTPNKAPNFYTA